MHSELSTSWTSFSHTLAQAGQNGANPVFNQANPGPAAPPAGGTTAPGGATPPGGGAAPPGNPLGFMLPLFLVLGFVILLQVFAARKQEKKRRALLSSIKKYDKVVTHAGIIGTVVELRDDEVVLKVDEHSSTKIRFTRSAIQQVLRPPGETDAKATSEIPEIKSKNEGIGAKS